MTVHKETRTYTGNRFNPVLMHVMASEQETSRPLLTPDEVMRLPEDAALIFVAGQPAIHGRKMRYYSDPVFSERAKTPPPAASDRLSHDWSGWTAWQPACEESQPAGLTVDAEPLNPTVAPDPAPIHADEKALA